MRTFARIGMLASFTLLVAGCATVPDFAEQGQKANLAIEQSANSTLLLNVVRAYHRRPLHFTSISSVKGPIGTGSPGFTIGLPAVGVDREFLSRRVFTPSVTYKVDTAAFDVAVWDGMEFVRGITTPVDAKTLVYFIDQGWPLELVMHLLVREVRLVDKAGAVHEQWLNYPGDPVAFARFRKAVAGLSGCNASIVPGAPARLTGSIPDPGLSDVGGFEGIAALKAQGLTVVHDDKTKATHVENRATPIQGITFTRMGGEKCTTAWDANATRKSILTLELHALSAALRSADPSERSLVFVLRSPEAALYYLGELSRSLLGDPLGAPSRGSPVTVRHAKTEYPLWILEKGAPPAGVKPLLQVSYEDEEYWIPAEASAGRSMQALKLVQLLINTQKNAKDLPATTTIRLIGQ